MSTSQDFDSLTEEVKEKRDVGIVTSAFLPRRLDLTPTESADQLVADQRFSPLGLWHVIDTAAARRILLLILGRDLAYGDATMAAADAEDLADRWLGLTTDPRVFLTNGTWGEDSVYSGEGSGPSWVPITESTFDAGVIAVDDQRAVILWVQDED